VNVYQNTTPLEQKNVLTVRGLTKVYGSRYASSTAKALNGLDLDVAPGEFVSIMGPSGSGKTTLLNLLAGLDKPTSGELFISGQDMGRLRSEQMALFRRQKLGFVFQDFNLLDTLTLAENVALPLTLDGRKGASVTGKVDEVLEELGILEMRNRYPYEVSGGQQQRTAVARAVVHDPSLILADEPTGNLDSGSAAALLQLLSRLNVERQATILMVTHDPFAASHSSRVVFIKDGRVFSRLDRDDKPETPNLPHESTLHGGVRRQFFQEILNTLGVLEASRQ
jgi:ABC-type lipoprotein export system ATPase subunit